MELTKIIALKSHDIASNFPESIPEQTGPLITPAALPTLNPQQIQQLQMAKKYCQDITNKFVSDTILQICPSNYSTPLMSLSSTVFVLIECKLKNNYASRDFLVKVVTCSIKIHYEKSQNADFLVLIRSCVLLA